MTTSADIIGRPSARFVFSHPAPLIAFGFGIGLIPFAPGTFGTLLAFPMYAWMLPRMGDQAFAAVLPLLFLIGVWACQVTGRRLGVHDHGGMVWDETVAFLMVLYFTPASPLWQAFAFLLFRVFDIVKPGVKFSELRRIAKEAQVKAGLPEQVVIVSPHSVGLQHDDNPSRMDIPFGGPYDHALEENMVLTIDLANVEIGWGAGHHEDLFRVTKTGFEYMAPPGDPLVII